MSKIFALYQRLMLRQPVMVQAIQTGLLMGTGDVLAQLIIEKKRIKEFQGKRTLKFAILGACLVGPSLHCWYGVLNRRFGSMGKITAIKKMITDQVIFAPSFLVIFLSVHGLMNGKDINDVKFEINNKYLDILLANYSIWPIIQLANFYFVPLQYQVLLVQLVALFWNTYLSWKTNQIVKEPPSAST